MIRSHVSTPVSRRTLLKSAAVGLSTIAPVKSFETTRAFSDPAPRVKGFIDQRENEAIRGLIQKFVEQYSLPGFSLAMTYQGELKLVACHGFAHQEKKVPVTPRHRFRLASVSKPITGATLIRLVEQKQIRLDDRIFGSTGWLKEFYNTSNHADRANRERLAALTLEHLLEHTGGGWGNRRRDPMFAHEALGLDHAKLIPWTIDAIPLERDPGESYDYSNFGYCLLGRVIEVVTGKPYQDAVQDTLFTPARVSGVKIARPNPRDRWEHEVHYYQKSSDPYGKSMNVHRMDAHGGWVASPTELMRWMRRIDGFKPPTDILTDESIRRMTTPSSTTLSYAKGWRVNAAKNWWHQGSFPGGSSFLARIADGTCWAIAVNTRSKDAGYTRALDQLPWKIKRAVTTWGEGDLFSQDGQNS